VFFKKPRLSAFLPSWYDETCPILTRSMPLSSAALAEIFNPKSIALAGISLSNPDHWTRIFYKALVEFDFAGSLYLVNPRGGTIDGRMVYSHLDEVPGQVDYVISTVGAASAPALVTQAAAKGARVVHFCTAGFGETGRHRGLKLERELAAQARESGVRIIGPNCMGLYNPASRLSFHTIFPKEPGGVGVVSQSGGNAIDLIYRAGQRGVRFSKVASYGNAVDLDESDFLEYLAGDAATRVVALYVEGVRDGARFRRALSELAARKPVVFLKGGVGGGGARATLSHTGALAGDARVWESLARQLGLITVSSLPEMVDVLVALQHGFVPAGNRAVLIGTGGGSSVLVTDICEREGLSVPPLDDAVREEFLSVAQRAGNMLTNPIDFSQNMNQLDKLARAIEIISAWDGADFTVGFPVPLWASTAVSGKVIEIVETMRRASVAAGRPLALVVEPDITPAAAGIVYPLVEHCAANGLPVFYSFSGAVRAISLVVHHHQERGISS
jgi:acyl-CoA synthetase (NDP forming)